MAEQPNYTNNSNTLVFGLDEFKYDTIEQQDGRATVVRFYVNNPAVKAGDMMVVLDDSTDIHFHGMIERLDEMGLAVAADRRGSKLTSSVVQ